MHFKAFICKQAHHAARLTAALPLMAGLALLVGGTHPALADQYANPTILKVTTSAPDVLVTFRDNDSAGGMQWTVSVFDSSGKVFLAKAYAMGVPGRAKVATVGLGSKFDPNAQYCAQVWAVTADSSIIGPPDDIYSSSVVCSDPPAPQTPPASTPPLTPATSPLGTQVGSPSQFCVACTVLTAPTNFSAQRDNVFGTTVILSWNSVSTATFYRVNAVSKQTDSPITVSGGSDIAGSATSFVVTGTAAQILGGTDFYLQACKTPDDCGPAAHAAVTGP
jgi:hypothetical protein